MRFEYANIDFDDLRGDLIADYLIAIDADFRISDGGKDVFTDPYFPVVELARSLVDWIRGPSSDDFLFSSLSSETTGLITISREGGGWVVFSALTPDVRSSPVPIAEIDGCVREFIHAVRDDLVRRGFDAARILGDGDARFRGVPGSPTRSR